MKKSYIYLMVAGLFLTTSCSQWVDTDINIDPNNPKDVPLELILPGVEAAWGYNVGSDISRFNSIFTQHHAGVDRQHLGLDVYSLVENDVDGSYQATYGTVMNELKIMIDKAGTESPHYSGVAKVLMSHALMVTTDLYGSVPFSEAFQLNDDLTPGYDTQEEIYATIVTMLADAKADLAKTESVFSPGSDDFVYGGDLALWTKGANALLARAYLHTANVNSGDYAKALTSIDAGAFEASADDMAMFFTAASTESNPLFQFMDQRGDIRMGAFFVDLMVGLDDPRLTVFTDTATNGGGYKGSVAGKPDLSANMPGSAYAATDASIPFITFVEQKFIEAEAALATGDKARAATAYNDAVIASLAKWGVSDTVYEAANAAEDENSITLETIMTQKYIAMYFSSESWSDWRRTGFPALTPADGQSKIPTRWPMAQSERFYNADNYSTLPSPSDIYAKVWWDAD